MTIDDLITLLTITKDNHGNIDVTVVAPTGREYAIEKVSVKTEYFNDTKVLSECRIILDLLNYED